MTCQETGLDKSNSTNYVSGLDPPFSKVLYQGKGHRWALLGLKTVESKFQSFSNDIICIIVYSIFWPDPPPKQRRGWGAAEAREEIPILRCLQPQPVIFHFFIQVLFLFPVEEVFIFSSDCEVHGPLLRKADQERRMSLQSRGAPIKVNAHQMANICNIYMHQMRIRFSHPHCCAYNRIYMRITLHNPHKSATACTSLIGRHWKELLHEYIHFTLFANSQYYRTSFVHCWC